MAYIQQTRMTTEEKRQARETWSTRFWCPEVSVRGLAAQYGVSKTTMHKILTGERA